MVRVDGAAVDWRLRVSSHDLAVAAGIAIDPGAPLSPGVLAAGAGAIERYVSARLGVTAGGRACNPGAIRVAPEGGGELATVEVRFACPQPVRRLGLGYALFLDVDPAHRALGRIVYPGGEEEVLFERAYARADVYLDAAHDAGGGAGFGGIFALGVEHILLGFDHLLFLFALLCVRQRFLAVAGVITAFTLAHSVSLALAWFEIVDLPPRPVEILIALSIAWVAADNLLGRTHARRWLLAGGLGLVHGLGFYGVLAGLGVDHGRAVLTLLAFNLGVEAGQIAFVGALAAPLAWAERQSWHPDATRAASGAILAAALWLAAARVA